MNLHKVEPGGQSPARGLGKSLNHGSDSGAVESQGHGVNRREGHGAGRYRLPAALVGKQQPLSAEGHAHAGLAPGVRQLNAGAHPLRMEKIRDAL